MAAGQPRAAVGGGREMRLDLDKPQVAVVGFSGGLVFALLCIGTVWAIGLALGLAIAAAAGVAAHVRIDPVEGKEGQQ